MKKEKYFKPSILIAEIEPCTCLAESKTLYSDEDLYVDEGNTDVKELDILHLPNLLDNEVFHNLP